MLQKKENVALDEYIIILSTKVTYGADQSTQHFENRGSPSGLVGQEMKWSIKFGVVRMD